VREAASAVRLPYRRRTSNYDGQAVRYHVCEIDEETEMTAGPADDPMVPLLIEELRGLLTSENLVDAANLHMARQDGWLLLHIMAVSFGRLGLLLATLSDPAELADLNSLSCRITPGDNRARPDQWQYELSVGRYSSNNDIVFSVKIRLPIGDLPEVVSRQRERN
jgi:hypothetical protein